MAKKKEEMGVPAIVDSVETLEAKMKAMREAQKEFEKFSQEQVDKIFYEAAMAANKMRIPLAKMAVEETQRGVLEDKNIDLFKDKKCNHHQPTSKCKSMYDRGCKSSS